MPKTGLVLPGGFSRLAAHVGFGHAWYNRSQTGDLPDPDYIVGISAGSLAGLIITQWDEDRFRFGEEILFRLKRGNFASLNPKLRNSGGLALATTLTLLSPTNRIKNHPYLKFAANVGLVAGAMYMEQRFFQDLFHSESFFVYDNLLKLIDKTADFKRVFDSPINYEAAAVDINNAGWRIGDLFKDPFNTNGWVSATNFKPEHKGNKELLKKGVAASARIWIFFDPEKTADGHSVVDGAALSNVPINFAIANDCDTIVVPYFDCPTEGPTNVNFNSWVKIAQRCADLTISSNTGKAMRGYIRVNKDIEQLRTEQRAMDSLERLADDPTVTEVHRNQILEQVRLAKEAQKKYSFYAKKKINLVIVSSRPLPPIHFSHFTKDDQLNGLNTGAQALEDSLPEIIAALNTVS